MSKTVKKVATKTATKNTSGKRNFVVVTQGVEFWNPEKKGEEMEGEFLEVMEFKGGKFARHKNAKGEKCSLKAIIKVDNGTEQGKQVALPDTAVISRFVETLTKGEFIKIVYEGKELKKGEKKGGQSVHKFTTMKEM